MTRTSSYAAVYEPEEASAAADPRPPEEPNRDDARQTPRPSLDADVTAMPLDTCLLYTSRCV